MSENRIHPKPLYFSKDLPFVPSDDQILYVEDKPYPEIHQFIKIHYDDIQKLSLEKSFEFHSLATAQTQTIPLEVLNYLYPYQHFDGPVQTQSYVTQDLLPFLTEGTIDGPMLIRYNRAGGSCRNEGDDRAYCFTSVPVFVSEKWRLFAPMAWQAQYGNHVSFEKVCLQSICRYPSMPASESEADDRFLLEVRRLQEEVLERIQKLRLLGVNESQLHNLITTPPKLSPLVITNEFNIFLPEYDNREIKMTPLVKAVFFLFLKHPEGIMFKNLPSHRKELLFLYKQLTPRMENDKIKQSVMDVTDPTKNSINEKCARIREAFLISFDDKFAEHYYVVGERCTPKKIMLDRSMVQWPDVLK